MNPTMTMIVTEAFVMMTTRRERHESDVYRHRDSDESGR
jgi:hypothetical protein